MNILSRFKHKKILSKVQNKNKIIRIIIYVICVILVALSYNIFFVPNEIVMGGIGGLAIVVKKLTGLSTSIFLLMTTIILLILSYILLGLNETKRNAICAILFPLVVSLTEPISKFFNIHFDSFLFTCIVAVISYSIPLGIIYKIGYSTGGGDILNQIVCKFFKTSVGQASISINSIIISISAFTLGFPKTVYAIFSLLLDSKIIDFIILGNSDSKLCIIKTKNVKYLENFLQKDFNIGYSLLTSSGGVDKKQRKTIMCVVTSREYYNFKNLVLDLDSSAFFITHDCYEVLGGKNKRLIDFNS